MRFLKKLYPAHTRIRRSIKLVQQNVVEESVVETVSVTNKIDDSEDIIKVMVTIGFESYLTMLRESVSKFDTAADVMKRAAGFVAWSNNYLRVEKEATGVEENGAVMMWEPSSLIACANLLGSEQSLMFSRYVTFLEKKRELTPASILIYLRQIRRFFEFVCSGHIRAEWRLPLQHWQLVNMLVSSITKLLKKRVSQSAWKLKDKTSLVAR
jgi:hypothetical protein